MPQKNSVLGHMYTMQKTDPAKLLLDNATPAKPVSTSSPGQKNLEPILFLSCRLTDAETRYCPTELKIAGIVWVVKKVRHLIEAAKCTTIIYTDIRPRSPSYSDQV